MRLKDKVAIITGGAHGMGEVEARLFAAGRRQGRHRRRAVEGRRGRCRRHFRRPAAGAVRAHRCHVGSRLAAADRRDDRAYGRLDILVNNAGISGSAVGDADGLEGWQRLLAVNATSVFLGTKLAAAEMAKTGGGSIVNISSIMGIVASEDSHPGYPASKAAVRNYTKAAACRYGPQGVRVNSVHPGYMPPMLNATNAAGRAAKIEQTPLRRLGEPIEVAYGVLFLASDEASFVTGAELVIDGGFIAH